MSYRVAIVIAVVVVSMLSAGHVHADHYLPNANHWAKASEPVRIGIIIEPEVPDQQVVADAAAAWSAAANVELGVVAGLVMPGDCEQNVVPQYGVITFCFSPERYGAGSGGAIVYTSCSYMPSPCDNQHIVAVKVEVGGNVLHNPYLYCHELGHALGLMHRVGSCMNAGWNGWSCPGAEDLEHLDALYSHDDGRTIGAGEFVMAGTDYCGFAPTPTAAPTMIATATPLSCRPPTAKRCRR